MKRINKYPVVGSKKPECNNITNGSCCFKKGPSAEKTCIDSISCAACKERGGSWSTASCNKRKNSLEAGCCQTCYKLPKNVNLAPTSKKYRTKSISRGRYH